MSSTSSVINSWADLASLIGACADGIWIFRGESDTSYMLKPKAGRVGNYRGAARKPDYDPTHERNAPKLLKRQARPYLAHTPSTDLEWLAIAQHHGMSTRLLDWTESMLVATYFATAPAASASVLTRSANHYVDSSRLAELRALRSTKWDCVRLIRLLEELNVAAANDCYMSIAMLVRSITDHVPPIFGKKNFAEVAENYSGGSSFRKSMNHLNSSLRNIADAHLHMQIRRAEVLPSATQVDFRADLDVLLEEVGRLVRDAG